MKPITQTNTGPTSISQQREKITFALNHGKQPKKSSTPQTGEHEESEETKASNAEGLKSLLTKSPEECKKESGTSLEQSETRGEELQVNEISSSVEEDKKQGRSSAGEKDLGNEPTFKGEF